MTTTRVALCPAINSLGTFNASALAHQLIERPRLVGEMGAIAMIRTFLNYFLERDLERAERAGERGMSPMAPEEHARTAGIAPAH